jgi:hypothetical protein
LIKAIKILYDERLTDIVPERVRKLMLTATADGEVRAFIVQKIRPDITTVETENIVWFGELTQ